MRGSLIDLFPAGEPTALRLDFFGDEIESVRRFDPADQRTIGPAEAFTLMPASEALLDEATIKRFRARYRETFGANATGDPLYQAVSEGRRLAGMEHWLPLFEESLATLFEHLGENDVWLRDAGTDGAIDARYDSIADYFDNRTKAMVAQPGSYRPLPPEALYLERREWDAAAAAMPVHLASPFSEPPSEKVIDFAVEAPRDFAPERAQNVNVYEAVAVEVRKLARAKKKVVLASYTIGARERLAGLLTDHGLKSLDLADTWQAALGVKADAALIVLPLDHGFTAADVAVLTEQDMLGDRLVRRRRRRKGADAFLSELAALSPGDLVVHAEHGIGRYEGLTSIKVGNAPHDCVALEYAGVEQALCPGREYRRPDPLRQRERRGSARQARRRGVAAAQEPDEGADPRDRRRADQDRRDPRHPPRRPGRSRQQLSGVRRPLPVRRDRRPGPRDRRGDRRSGGGAADGPAGVRRRRLRQDRSGDARGVRHRDVGDAGRAGRADHACLPASITPISSSAFTASRSTSGGCRGWSRRPKPRRLAKAWRTARSTSSSAPTRSSANRSSSRNSASSLSTRSSISG